MSTTHTPPPCFTPVARPSLDLKAEVLRLLDNVFRQARPTSQPAFHSIDMTRPQMERLREFTARLFDESAALVPVAWRDVQAERLRQISHEGWTPEHDDQHHDGELAYAAGGYAVEAADSISGMQTTDPVYSPLFPEGWEFKRADPRRMLVKAAALLLAEIERLDRANGRPA